VPVTEHPKFIYDTNESYEDNFKRWRRMNNDERSEEQERLLSSSESRKVFDDQYSEYQIPDKYQGITSDNADYFVQEEDDG
tara:strand:- start:1137 stop:1379 length:243 start_codon:yes stop_codon:yes gene_type:complete